MKKRYSKILAIITILTLLLTLAPASLTHSQALSSKHVIAYFPNWGIYSAAHKSMTVDMIPWTKITGVNHAFFEVNASFKLACIDPYADFDKMMAHSEGYDPGQLRGHFGEYKYFKTVYPNVKIMVSVGGWTRGRYFHDMAMTAASRAIFVQSCVDFLKQYPFIDGIDIDWEYPGVNRMPDPYDQYDFGCPGGPEDKVNYTLLLKELREGFNNNGLSGKYLSAATAAGYDKLLLQEPNIYHQYLSWINVMTFDMHGAWELVTNHQSPLYPNPNDPSGTSPTDIKNKYNVDYAMKTLRDTYGIPASKLNAAAPFYSRGWSGVTGGTNGMFANATGAATGPWDNPASPGGQFPYWQLKTMENTGGYVKYRDTYNNAPWLYSASAGITLTYEDDVSLLQKLNYLNSNGFGGIMIWEITGDDDNYSLTNLCYQKLVMENDTVVATPSFSLASGTYTSPQTVTLSCITAGATIRYTTNGSEPTSASTQYTGAITLPIGATTLKAKAFKAGMTDSDTATATYTIIDGSIVAAPVFNPAGGAYSAPLSVIITTSTSGATIRYTLDGTEPTSASNQYVSPISLPVGTTTVKAKAFKLGSTDSSTTSAVYNINTTEGTDIGTPSGSPSNPSLWHDNWDGNGSYNLTFNIWWGNNATSWKLFENNIEIFSSTLQGNSPNAQSATFAVSGKAAGSYTYKAELKNAYGTTTTSLITVAVNN